ncbi:YCF48-related protein [Halopseudomonas sp. SMJS2]|uniref:WD40/YVTN/BNR-like repeat-containing protein n=1 Tax=Halopseudomonas sp. SMJS2 TaxID=3041098 RepID=UPI00245346D7|nr:YCF48-related protein [Halopseudomonas sp. SMJS2]WGK62460.1 YCF48-related protein [Halopseudomonas sp. SMJS2]
MCSQFCWQTLLRACALLALSLFSLGALAFESPMVRPATPTAQALSHTLHDIAAVGDRMVAVGVHGHIAYSDDQGHNWQQANVPVSEDLLAISFADESFGLVVGHGGVILRTRDAGESWQLVLEGKEASQLFDEFYSQAVAEQSIDGADILYERESFLREYGGTQSLMDVHCVSTEFCVAVGIFNRLLISRDAGETWQPWSHRIDNPMELHFYSIQPWNESMLIAGEQGHVWVFDQQQEYFDLRLTGYTGTLFGALGAGENIVAHGMRGTVVTSADRGSNWQEVNVGTNAGVTNGVVKSDGTIVLGTLSGDLLISVDNGKSFEKRRLPQTMGIHSLALLADERVAIVGGTGFYPALVKVQGLSPLTLENIEKVTLIPHNNKK